MLSEDTQLVKRDALLASFVRQLVLHLQLQLKQSQELMIREELLSMTLT